MRTFQVDAEVNGETGVKSSGATAQLPHSDDNRLQCRLPAAGDHRHQRLSTTARDLG
jgi:hypothetical protein